MEVVGLWRYPVKSLQGEAIPVADFEADGILGDRQWGIRDGRTDRILTARRRPELLAAAASYDDGTPVITLPDGRVSVGPGEGTDRLLSEWLGSPVSLVPSVGTDPGRAEYFADATDDTSQAIEWTMPEGRYVDAAAVLAPHHGIVAHRRRSASGGPMGSAPLPTEHPARSRGSRVGRGRMGRRIRPGRWRRGAAAPAVHSVHDGDQGAARARRRQGHLPHPRASSSGQPGRVGRRRHPRNRPCRRPGRRRRRRSSARPSSRWARTWWQPLLPSQGGAGCGQAPAMRVPNVEAPVLKTRAVSWRPTGVATQWSPRRLQSVSGPCRRSGSSGPGTRP